MNTSSTFVSADADGYEQMMGRWSRRLAQPFLDFAGTREPERVLDLGCGTGHLAAAIAVRAGTSHVEGIDLSPAYIARAQASHGGARLAFKVGDACALPFPDGHFDRILSLLVLHFVPRYGQAIAEMRRVARPGGVIAATVWDARGGYVANRMFFDTAAALDAQGAERRARNLTRPLTRPGELAAAWRAAGLEAVEETSLCIRMEFASFEDYWAPYMGRDGPGAEYVQSLETAQRERLEAAVRAAYLDGEPDGPRSYAALAWAVKGVVPTSGGLPKQPD
ncbi:MAG: class I SAM-dependent methyltransferase [Ramlibacter sp.]|nr:class I SAM-dependent methyltransferase [Ramlibacter sp.]